MPTFGGRLRNTPTGWFGLDPGFGQNDWLEAVAMYSPTQFAMGRKRSHATLTGYVPFGRIAGCLKFMLGYSWVDADKFLRREPPAAHPWFPTLYATELLELRGVKFISKAAAIHPLSLPYAKYTLAQVTIGFSQPPYEILTDNDLNMTDFIAYRGEEMRRWCYWTPEPYLDLLELPGGMVVFDAPGETFDGRPIIAPRNVYRAEKENRVVNWINVPIEFIQNEFGFWPKVGASIGKVNTDVFFGDPTGAVGSPGRPGTWLLDNVKTKDNEVYADPIASAAFEGITRRVDLQFMFKYFNPPNGRTDGDATAGWPLMLAANGKFYPTKNAATGLKNSFPGETSFLKLFTHYTDT